MSSPRTLDGRRLLLLTQGAWDHASSRVRAAAYLPALQGAGLQVTWLPRIPEGPSGVRRAVSKRVRTGLRSAAVWAGSWDLVLAQRQHLAPGLLRRLQRRGIPLVYDIDDAIYLPTARDEARTAAMVQAATRVVVSAPELATYCERLGASTVRIPTPVDTDRFSPGPASPAAPLVVGWVGSPTTTPYLREIEGAVARLAAERPVRVLLVGDDASVAFPGVDVERAPWNYEDEPALLRRMHVGVMPLPDTPWTRGKAGYKLLLYMATGLPVVASPVGVNPEIVRDGETGYLARTEEEWYRALRRLAADADLRAALGRAGRARAEATYSRAVCAPALLHVLTDALSL